jgi:hypothetical protein
VGGFKELLLASCSFALVINCLSSLNVISLVGYSILSKTMFELRKVIVCLSYSCIAAVISRTLPLRIRFESR